MSAAHILRKPYVKPFRFACITQGKRRCKRKLRVWVKPLRIGEGDIRAAEGALKRALNIEMGNEAHRFPLFKPCNNPHTFLQNTHCIHRGNPLL